jgi:DNA processing protein
LYAKGQIEALAQPIIAIIGPRQPSRQAIMNSAAFASKLVEVGLCICAELAEGVGAIALQAAVKTGLPHCAIGIAASGLNLVYPTKLTGLSQQIENVGLLVSQYPSDSLAYAKHLQERRRLIASICHAVLVIEGTTKSETIATANYAAELGRDIFSIPGSIHEAGSKGPHSLIKNGAKLVEDIDDILHELSFLTIK